MTKANKTFRERMKDARPDVAANLRDNAIKVAIARKLRVLRDARGMTQKEVAEASGMPQSSIARLESLSGSTPTLESIQRFVDACGGQLDVVISTKARQVAGSAAEPSAA